MLRPTLAILLALTACTQPEVTARQDFTAFCAACHGDDGKGGGEAAGPLGKRPANLTTIAARNGGTFPRVRVMSVIDGYTRRDQHGSLMPEFGALLEEGELQMVETEGGILTPTPARLVALATYIESIQQ
ncbi:MAG: cytochrome c [Paracoccaceae bacterium]